jgi:hypothetical protein
MGGVSVDLKKGLVEMTLRKNPIARGSKGVVKLGLGDFEEGQKVVAVVKRVCTRTSSTLIPADRLLGRDIWYVLTD